MLALAYLSLIIAIFLIEFFRKKENSFDFLTLFNFFFVLQYPLPAFLLSSNLKGSEALMLSPDQPYLNISNIQTPLAIFIGYFLVLWGFQSQSAQKKGKKRVIKNYSDRYIIQYIYALFLFGSLAIVIYTQQYDGGLIGALQNTILIRSDLIEAGPLVFFKNFMYFIFFASYLLASFIFIKKSKKSNLLLQITFALSLIISLIAAFLSSGRGVLLYYVLAFFLVYILQTGKTFSLTTILIILGAGLFLIYGKHIFFSFTGIQDGLAGMIEKFTASVQSQGQESTSIYEFLAEFAFPLHSLDAAFNSHYNLRLFVDWFYGLMYYIPERLSGITKPFTITAYNTTYLLGKIEIFDRYGIPPGFLAYGIYSLSWPGLIFISWLYGWIGRYLQTVFTNNLHDIYWMPFVYVLSAQMWIHYQLYGDPRVFLILYLWAFISIFFLFYLTRQSEQRN